MKDQLTNSFSIWSDQPRDRAKNDKLLDIGMKGVKVHISTRCGLSFTNKQTVKIKSAAINRILQKSS